MQKCWGNIFEKKIRWPQMIPKCLIQREMAKKIHLEMAVFGGSDGFAAVSSQFLNKHHKSNCHTKAHCSNLFFG